MFLRNDEINRIWIKEIERIAQILIIYFNSNEFNLGNISYQLFGEY